MRDVGILVWFVLIVVGVIGSIASTVRKQLQAQGRVPNASAPQRRVSRVVAGPPPPPPVVPRVAPAGRAVERRVAPPADPQKPTTRRFLPGKNDLVRAVIAAEVLGKPRAFNDEYAGH